MKLGLAVEGFKSQIVF